MFFAAEIMPCFWFGAAIVPVLFLPPQCHLSNVPCFWHGAVIVPACFDLLSHLSCDWCQDRKAQKKHKEEEADDKKK